MISIDEVFYLKEQTWGSLTRNAWRSHRKSKVARFPLNVTRHLALTYYDIF